MDLPAEVRESGGQLQEGGGLEDFEHLKFQ